VKLWDYSTVERAIRDVIEHTEGHDWSSVASKIACYGHSEFEDYRP